jgi:hypothetical protein
MSDIDDVSDVSGDVDLGDVDDIDITAGEG